MATRQSIRWLAALVYLVFLGGLVEGSLQAFYYATAGNFLFARVDIPIWASNPYSGFWNRANLDLDHRTNEFRTKVFTSAEGFRVAASGREYRVEKDPSTFRAMLLGPSFAFGWGVAYEDSFAARLEALLQRSGVAGGRTVELINAGVPALSPAPQLHWFEVRGREFQPDLVIQFIYGSMVIGSNNQEVTADGYLVPRGITPLGRLQRQLKSSATVFYGWIIYTRLRSLWASDETPQGIQGAGRELTERTRFDPGAADLKSSLEFYDDLARAAVAAGGRALVVYFPLSYSVHPEDMARWRHLGARNVEAQMAFDDAFCRYLDAQKLPCVNITQDLVEAARGEDERLYYWLDVHWTSAGNRVAAEAVARHLVGRDGSTAEAAAAAP